MNNKGSGRRHIRLLSNRVVVGAVGGGWVPGMDLLPRARLWFPLTLFLLFLALSWVGDTASNKSSSVGGMFWATAKDELSQVERSDAEEPAAVEPDEMEEGGFSSVESMLQWAIGHSDPAKLREAAQDVKHLPSSEIKKRQAELQDLMEKLKMPSDADLMKVAIADLNNSSLSFDERYRALNELLILVEPIDNANDLYKLGGLDAVIKGLNSSESEIRTMSAWVLGEASQNNPLVQKQLVASSPVEEAVKALYAVSALIRNNVEGQQIFYAADGELMLRDIMSNSSCDIRLRKKSAVLAADLAVSLSANTHAPVTAFLHGSLFLKTVVDLTAEYDLDLQEKALIAIRSLLQLGTTEAKIFKDFCELGKALENMRRKFEELMLEEDQKEFVQELEILRQEVEHVFLKKLEKVPE
ncbi:uncharacterized protein LOC116248482 isoform X2 [Nymphaea colorata]|uniref:uncharacterized protein LOC116248482 isoform X2 n=1 Tax=Nymphaea colorata TaxID=210225 RepID=UPI00129D904F|nr:uncharacterized protein LOC116248482 isoform X2 [Nymphaea colorata]